MKKILLLLLFFILNISIASAFDIEEAFNDLKEDGIYEYKGSIYNIDNKEFVIYNKENFAKEIGYEITKEDEKIFNQIDNTFKSLYKTSEGKEKADLLFKKLQKANLQTLDKNNYIKKGKKRLHFLLFNILEIANSYYYKDQILSFQKAIDSGKEMEFWINSIFNSSIFKIVDKTYISKYNSDLEYIFNNIKNNEKFYYKGVPINIELNKGFAINSITNLGYTVDEKTINKGDKLKKYISIYSQTEEGKKEIDKILKLIELYINDGTIINFDKDVQYLTYLFIEYSSYETQKEFFINQATKIDKYSKYTSYKNLCIDFYNRKSEILNNPIIKEIQGEKCDKIIKQLDLDYIFEGMLKETFMIYNEKEGYPYKLEIRDSYSGDYYCKETSYSKDCLWINQGEINNKTSIYYNK